MVQRLFGDRRFHPKALGQDVATEHQTIKGLALGGFRVNLYDEISSTGTTQHGRIHRSNTSMKYIITNYFTGYHMFEGMFKGHLDINESDWIWNTFQLTLKNPLQNGFTRTLSGTTLSNNTWKQTFLLFFGGVFAPPLPRPPPQPNPLRTVPLGKTQRIRLLMIYQHTGTHRLGHPPQKRFWRFYDQVYSQSQAVPIPNRYTTRKFRISGSDHWVNHVLFGIRGSELPTTQDASHHQDYDPSLVGKSRSKPSFATVSGWRVDPSIQ